MQVLCASLRQAASESTLVECSDGYERDICPVVAAWLGDREEHELIASIVKVQYKKNTDFVQLAFKPIRKSL